MKVRETPGFFKREYPITLRLQLKSINEEWFNYYKPKHYVIYLFGKGLYQVAAQGYEVIEDE